VEEEGPLDLAKEEGPILLPEEVEEPMNQLGAKEKRTVRQGKLDSH
jgi:hypothetical protein